MMAPPLPTVSSPWKQILVLGRRLSNQPSLADKRQTILTAVRDLVDSQVDLWLCDALCHLSGPNTTDCLLPTARSDLMSAAIETRRTALDPAGVDECACVRGLAIPLYADDTLLGALEVRRATGPALSKTELGWIEWLADQAALGLQAYYLKHVEHRRLEQLALVSTISDQLADVLDLDQLSRRITDLIYSTFYYYYVALFIPDSAHQSYVCWASAGPRTTPNAAASSFPSLRVQLGEGIVGTAASTGTQLVANDVSREPRYRHIDALSETRAEVAVPLKIEDRVLGVLDVQSDRLDAFQSADLLVLNALADNIAVAVEHAHLWHDLRRRADRVAAAAEVGRAITSILDINVLFEQVVTIIQRQFGYPFVHLYTVDPGQKKILYQAGRGSRSEPFKLRGQSFSLDEPQGLIPWAVQHRQTVVANDVSQDPRYRPAGLPPEITVSELVVPLLFGQEALGVIDLQSDQNNAFDDLDQLLFEALADSVAVAIRNANLYRTERWRRQVADSMREAAGMLSKDLLLEEVFDAILGELEETLPCDIAAIWLLEDDELRIAAVRGSEPGMLLNEPPALVGQWLLSAMETEDPTIRLPSAAPDALQNALGFPDDYSAIAAPLRAGAERLGLLTLAHRTYGRYGAEAQVILSAFASYAAVAIENARLYQDAQEQAHLSGVMLQVAEVSQSHPTLDQTLTAVVQLASRLAGIRRCAILLWDESSSSFGPGAAFGLDAEQETVFAQCRITPKEMPQLAALLLGSSPSLLSDVSSDPVLAASKLPIVGFESLLTIPLRAQERILGAMLFDYHAQAPDVETLDSLLDARLAIVQGIAYQTATAIENASLRQAQLEDAYVSAALLQVAQSITSLSDLDEILHTIVRIAPLLIGVQRCAILIWDREKLGFCLSAAFGLSPDLAEQLQARQYAPGQSRLLDTVREYKLPVTSTLGPVEDPAVVAADLHVDWPHEGGQSDTLLALPLAVKGDLLGAMLLQESGSARGSREKRLEIMVGIAQQAASAIQNERLQVERVGRERIERELQLAHDIQQAFIPRTLPRLPGWEMAAIWRAARQVAGDFYDIFELSGDRLGLVVADVADKGIAAALFMALTRTMMRAAALSVDSPAAVLAQVNEWLVPDAPHGMFVTAFYGILCPRTGTLTYANAGHNLPLWLRAGTDDLYRLEKGEMALGVMPGIVFQEHAVSLDPGDVLFLYTDGVTEAFSPDGEMYGDRRLEDTLRQAHGSTAHDVLQAVDRAVLSFVGDSAAADDLTLVLVARKAELLAPDEA